MLGNLNTEKTIIVSYLKYTSKTQFWAILTSVRPTKFSYLVIQEESLSFQDLVDKLVDRLLSNRLKLPRKLLCDMPNVQTG